MLPHKQNDDGVTLADVQAGLPSEVLRNRSFLPQLNLISLRLQKNSNHVSLYKALGGGGRSSGADRVP